MATITAEPRKWNRHVSWQLCQVSESLCCQVLMNPMRIVFRLQDKNKAYIKFHLLLSPLWCWRKFIFWSINLTDLTRWHRGLASVTVSIVKNHSLSFHSIHVIAWSKIAWSKISCATKMLWFEVKYWNILFWGNYSGFSPSFSNKSTFFYTYIETIHTINFIHFKYIIGWVLEYAKYCKTIILVSFRTFLSPQRESLYSIPTLTP